MTPIRTCVGCGARAGRGELVRLVARDGGLRLDPRGRLPGRGAYLHRAPACHAAFARRGGAIRSLRTAVGREGRESLVAALGALGARG